MFISLKEIALYAVNVLKMVRFLSEKNTSFVPYCTCNKFYLQLFIIVRVEYTASTENIYKTHASHSFIITFFHSEAALMKSP